MILTDISPRAAMPGGELLVTGSDLGPEVSATVSGLPARVTLARPNAVRVRVPEGVFDGEVVVERKGLVSNGIAARIALPMAENVHPVSNPAADEQGNLYTTLSGARGQQLPVSIFRIPPAPEGQTHQLQPFVRDLLNPSGLAFSRDGDLYVSSRAEGTVYRIDPQGTSSLFAEGLGIATGLAFDEAGDLYVGDRSGTIFKIRMTAEGRTRSQTQETFVFATLEPSIAAYHLAFDSKGVLYVTGPTTSSSQSIQAIDRNGTARIFYRGLGRAQGLAFDVDDNLYVAASYAGDRGIICITQGGVAQLVLSGPNLVGLCFLPEKRLALATRDAVYEVDFGVEGRSLI